jgi:signal-transduction protein with cAMP-binding, CBS, and nucleotidyltransferase domain
MKKFPTIVSDIMSSPVLTVDESVSVRKAAEKMTQNNVGTIVVTKNREPIGIVTERDMLNRIVSKGRDPESTRIMEIVSKPLRFVDKDLSILEAMRVMRDSRIRRLLVKDKDQLVGITTDGDMLRALSVSSLSSFSLLLRN